MSQELSSLQQKLANESDPDTLIRLHAVDKTIEFLKDRSFTDFKTFDTVFEIIYNNILNFKKNERLV